MKTYSKMLTPAQNAAFEQFENVTSCEPFALTEFERGEITAKELWQRNVGWIVDAVNTVQHIQFPE